MFPHRKDIRMRARSILPYSVFRLRGHRIGDDPCEGIGTLAGLLSLRSKWRDLPMDRYYFHVREGDEMCSDTVGNAFGNLDVVRSHARGRCGRHNRLRPERRCIRCPALRACRRSRWLRGHAGDGAGAYALNSVPLTPARPASDLRRRDVQCDHRADFGSPASFVRVIRSVGGARSQCSIRTVSSACFDLD